MVEIKFSPEAIADLQETKQYITEELCNEQAANNTIAKILASIRQLERFPEMGAPLSSVIDLDTDYRFLVSGNYSSFYRYVDGTVYIVRVLYGRRNYMQILFGEPKED